MSRIYHFIKKYYLISFFVGIGQLYCQQRTVQIDFGSAEGTASWNILSNPADGAIDNLLDTQEEPTGIRIAVSDAFSGVNQNGTMQPTALGFPALVSRDSFYGNEITYAGRTEPTAGITLENLDPQKEYTLRFFASRMGVTDTRETAYTIHGNTSATRFLNVSGNTSTTVQTTVKPAADGTIRIDIAPGPNNTNIYKFYYLGAITLQYEEAPIQENLEEVQVDFGGTSSTNDASWNTLTNPLSGGIQNLQTVYGRSSGIQISVHDAFSNVNNSGARATDASLNLSEAASGDSFYGNTATFNGKTEATGGVTLSNLDPQKSYRLSLFASRMGVTDNRETTYEIIGAETVIDHLNVSNNTDKVAVAAIHPKQDGTITIIASPGENNTNSFGFYYLGALRLSYTSSIPKNPELALISPSGREFWQVGKSPEIQWSSKDIEEVSLSYSIDNGVTWITIATVAASSQSFTWQIPENPTENCLIRIISGNLSDQNETPFEIANDTGSCPIVVLGSSTAAGTGASVLQNSWVERYAKAIFQKNTRYTITNLAKGGYTTYQVLPTGTEIPEGRSIDTERNITKAISMNPFGIIINLPTNDTAKGYSVTEQLDNYATLANAAAQAGVKLWIATPQPRNFPFPHYFDRQIEVRDAILNTYGEAVVNFWNPIADDAGRIIPEYDSGDGIHLNDIGHELLFQEMYAKNIHELDCSNAASKSKLASQLASFSTKSTVFPNPFQEELYLNYDANSAGSLQILGYDITSKKVLEQTFNTIPAGQNTLQIDVQNVKKLQSKVLFITLVYSTNKGEVLQERIKLFRK